jgi:hypothetical protein
MAHQVVDALRRPTPRHGTRTLEPRRPDRPGDPPLRARRSIAGVLGRWKRPLDSVVVGHPAATDSTHSWPGRGRSATLLGVPLVAQVDVASTAWAPECLWSGCGPVQSRQSPSSQPGSSRIRSGRGRSWWRHGRQAAHDRRDSIIQGSRPELLTHGVPCGAITVLQRTGLTWQVDQLPATLISIKRSSTVRPDPTG